MDKIIVDLCSSEGSVEVEIKRKPIKNVHLKVYRNLSVVVSAPVNVPDKWLEKFLQTKAKWIDKQLLKYRETSGYNNLTNLKNGSSIQFLGKDKRIFRHSSSQNKIALDEKSVNFHMEDCENDEAFQKLFRNWWRAEANRIYLAEMQCLYDTIFKKYQIPFPILLIRKMDTLWGSCTKSRNKIVLNEYLLKADKLCIQYVILHELTHLLYNKHNTDFYTFLSIHMPDWKERKKRLDNETVQGL